MNKPKRILLVEDNRHDQFFFLQVLSEIENATIYHIANNGEEALAKLNSGGTLPDIIFSDIHMPVMNGIECLEEIVNNPRTKAIPVVMLSSATDAVERVRQIGAKGFIVKGSDCQALREQLQQMINHDFIADSDVANQTFQTALSVGPGL
jgi:CheY-like chemotaxis protein